MNQDHGGGMIDKIIVFLLIAVCAACAQDTNTKDEQKTYGQAAVKKGQDVPDGKMKQYFMVFLKRGPIRDQDTTAVEELQKQHIANINRLAQEGLLDLAGPFGHDGDLRGIFILNVPTYDDAKAACDRDPMIKCGRLVAEIYPWWAMKGSKLR